MKKTYITPETLTVVLGTCKMMAESMPVNQQSITNPNEILTKENRDVNIWDNEW